MQELFSLERSQRFFSEPIKPIQLMKSIQPFFSLLTLFSETNPTNQTVFMRSQRFHIFQASK